MADTLRVESRPRPEDVEALNRHLYQFNIAAMGGIRGDDLAIFVRGPDGALQGGIYGFTWAGWLEIKVLWVHEAQRGQGLGSRLLLAAEAEGRRRGAHTALLDTHTFQAPDFYAKFGYEAYATIDGYPAGHSKILFRKRLTNDEKNG